MSTDEPTWEDAFTAYQEHLAEMGPVFPGSQCEECDALWDEYERLSGVK